MRSAHSPPLSRRTPRSLPPGPRPMAPLRLEEALEASPLPSSGQDARHSELAARLGEERHVRRPAAGDREQVAVDLIGCRASLASGRSSARIVGGVDAAAAVGPDDRGVAVDGDAAPRGLGEMPCANSRRRSTTAADSPPARAMSSAASQPESLLVEDEQLPAGQHAVAVHVGAHRAGQHDPRPVVLVEDQRPLERAGREHHLLRPHAPEPLARQRSRRRSDAQMVGDALPQPDEVVRVVAEGGGAGEHRHLRHAASSCATDGHPVGRGLAVDSQCSSGSRDSSVPPSAAVSSARMTRAPDAAGGERRHQSRRAAADDQHVAMAVRPPRSVSGSGCDGARPRPAARRISGSKAIQPRPALEGLVVEAGGE